MTIQYEPDERDFLVFQLYTASKSLQIIKRRRRNKTIIPLIYILAGLFFLLQDQYFTAVVAVMAGVIWIFAYPFWDRRQYVNHYKGFIKENYKERVGKPITIEIQDDYILAKDDGSESKILTTELDAVNEITEAVFIKLKGGQSLILPKDKITGIDNVTARLRVLAGSLNIHYNLEAKWVWK